MHKKTLELVNQLVAQHKDGASVETLARTYRMTPQQVAAILRSATPERLEAERGQQP